MAFPFLFCYRIMIINCWKIDLLCLIFRKLYDHWYYLLSSVFTWLHAQWTVSLVQPPNFKNPKLSFTHKSAHHFTLTEDHIVTLSERSLSGWEGQLPIQSGSRLPRDWFACNPFSFLSDDSWHDSLMMQDDDSLPTRLTCGVEGSRMTTRDFEGEVW